MNQARKWIALTMIVALLLAATPALAAGEPTRITGKSMMHFVVDGVEYAPPDGALGGFFYHNNGTHTYVPIRFVAYILKKDVQWNGQTRKVSVFDPKTEEDAARIEAYLAERAVSDALIEPVGPVTAEVLDVQVVPDVTYEFNDVKAEAGEHTPGLLIDGSIYVPIRFITENLGYKVSWDQATYTISTEIAEVDRIVNKYRELAETMKGDVIEEATGMLNELGITNPLDVLTGKVSEEQMAQLVEIGKDFLPEVEQQLNDLLAAMTQELVDLEQPTLLADQLHKELEGLLNLARNYLADGGADS